MQYLALIYAEDGVGPKPGDAEWDDYMNGFFSANKAYADAGVMNGGNALQHTETATSVRIRDGKTETMDGPFAETKERLGGYYLLDCKDLDQAIEMAALIPTARFGTIELRPIMQIPGDG
ncbi:MAG: YciI family protein [Silicimonas sp.]|nr:YciI family protein [Silicimonas sp.]NNF91368.1 YciI family protein [Boseongicola sp.]RZW04217.1 MAG: YciI family protein [Paracoccaceae bacterium]MBT8423551.1 YciI family protein [Silicimonas sp.]NND18215.1 YciI family protein [Silicimonas sp.]